MIAAIRSLPRWLETAVVVLGAFGLFAFSSTYELFEQSETAYTAGDFVWLVQFEIVVGTILLSFLFARGWRLNTFGLVRPSWNDAIHALLLFVALLLGSWILWAVFAGDSEPAELNMDGSGIPVAIALIFSALNAAYEELFVCAYLIAATKSLGLAPAMLLSTVVRLSYHTYQGPLGLMLLVPLGLMFAWYFAKRERVMPLVGAHLAFDVIALLPHIRL